MSTRYTSNYGSSFGFPREKKETIVLRERSEEASNQFLKAVFERRKSSSEKGGGILGIVRKIIASKKTMSDADVYVLECTKQNRIPIGHYVENFSEQSLTLSYSNIGPEDFQPLSSSLARNQTITTLDLSHNWLGDDVCFLKIIIIRLIGC